MYVHFQTSVLSNFTSYYIHYRIIVVLKLKSPLYGVSIKFLLHCKYMCLLIYMTWWFRGVD